MTSTYVVESRRDPPNHDIITQTECRTQAEAYAVAKRVKGAAIYRKTVNEDNDVYLYRLPDHDPRPIIAIVVEGGLIQAIVSNGDPSAFRIVSIDYDTDGVAEEALTQTPQVDGSLSAAQVYSHDVEPATVDMSVL